MEPSIIQVLHFLCAFECEEFLEENRLVCFTIMAITDSDSLIYSVKENSWGKRHKTLENRALRIHSRAQISSRRHTLQKFLA